MWNEVQFKRATWGCPIFEKRGGAEPVGSTLDQVSASAFAEMIGGHVLFYGPAAAGTVSVTQRGNDDQPLSDEA